MRLLTLNTHSLIDDTKLGLWADRFGVFVEEFIEGDYAVVAFQEVNQLAASKPASPEELERSGFCPADPDFVIREDNFALALATELRRRGLEYYWTYAYSHIGYDIYEEGTVILSKLPILKAFQLAVSPKETEGTWRYRRIAGVTLAPDLTVFSGHFGWWSPEDDPNGFRAQWDRLEDALKGLPKSRLILMGDLNCPDDEAGQGLDHIKDHGWIDLAPLAPNYVRQECISVGGTIDGWEGNADIARRIDYIVTDSKDFVPTSTEVHFNGKRKHRFSDHYGVVVEITY